MEKILREDMESKFALFSCKAFFDQLLTEVKMQYESHPHGQKHWLPGEKFYRCLDWFVNGELISK